MNFCLEIVPTAQSMRTHALVQSSIMFAHIADTYPSITTDVSLLLPSHDRLTPTELFIGNSNRKLIRVPYFWEDDIFAVRPDWQWKLNTLPTNGLRVFDFHPAYVALNINSMTGYNDLKDEIYPRKLFEASRDEFSPYVNSKKGSRTFLESIIATEDRNNYRTISDITRLFEKGQS